jgi:hypothetical protein
MMPRGGEERSHERPGRRYLGWSSRTWQADGHVVKPRIVTLSASAETLRR